MVEILAAKNIFLAARNFSPAARVLFFAAGNLWTFELVNLAPIKRAIMPPKHRKKKLKIRSTISKWTFTITIIVIFRARYACM